MNCSLVSSEDKCASLILMSRGGSLDVGARVQVFGVGPGVLRYAGSVHFARGAWYGVEVSHGGTLDGSVGAVKYFSCPENRGVFVTEADLQVLLPPWTEESSDDAQDMEILPMSFLAGSTDSVGSDNFDDCPLLSSDDFPLLPVSSRNMHRLGSRYVPLPRDASQKCPVASLPPEMVHYVFWGATLEDMRSLRLASKLFACVFMPKRIVRHGLTGSAACAISEALSLNDSVTDIQLPGSTIGLSGSQALAKALTTGRASVTNLDLTGSNLLRDCGTVFGSILRSNTSLRTLCLRGTRLSAASGAVIGEALQYNRTLTSLDLSNNIVGSQGARGVAIGLQHNNSLTALNLSFDFIGDDGAIALAHAMDANRTIRAINLEGNCVGEWGLSVLTVAFKFTQAEFLLQDNYFNSS